VRPQVLTVARNTAPWRFSVYYLLVAMITEAPLESWFTSTRLHGAISKIRRYCVKIGHGHFTPQSLKFTIHLQTKPNVVVEYLTLLLRIREVLASNLGPESGYWLKFFVVFISPCRQILELYLQLGHGRFLPNLFQFIIHISTLHSTLYILSYWKTSLNKLQINN
jgi:hypothetical protein